MGKLTLHRKHITPTAIAIICVIYCTSAVAGGGGGAGLDNKEGLETAAEDFLFAFVSLANPRTAREYTYINDPKDNEKAKSLSYLWTDLDSRWDYIIVKHHPSAIIANPDISREEYEAFREEYLLQKRMNQIAEFEAGLAAHELEIKNSIKNTAATSK